MLLSLALLAPAWALGLWAWASSVPFVVWGGILSAGGVAGWWAVNRWPKHRKIKALRDTANAIERFGVWPLQAIAPRTPSDVDDKALEFLRASVAEMRAQANAAERGELKAGISSPAEIQGALAHRQERLLEARARRA